MRGREPVAHFEFGEVLLFEPEGDEIDCLPKCEVIPEGGFDPTVKFHWSGGDSMMTPVVVQLDDDNCDDIVDERDIPEIVFATFVGGAYTENGTLRVISIVGGQIVEKWQVNPQAPQMNPGLSIAAPRCRFQWPLRAA